MALPGPTRVPRTNFVVDSSQFYNPPIKSPPEDSELPLQTSKLSKFPNSVFPRLHNQLHSYSPKHTHTEIPLTYLQLYLRLLVTKEERSSCPLICNHRTSTRSSTAYWFQTSEADHIYQLSYYTLVGSYFLPDSRFLFFWLGSGVGWGGGWPSVTNMKNEQNLLVKCFLEASPFGHSYYIEVVNIFLMGILTFFFFFWGGNLNF